MGIKWVLKIQASWWASNQMGSSSEVWLPLVAAATWCSLVKFPFYFIKGTYYTPQKSKASRKSWNKTPNTGLFRGRALIQKDNTTFKLPDLAALAAHDWKTPLLSKSIVWAADVIDRTWTAAKINLPDFTEPVAMDSRCLSCTYKSILSQFVLEIGGSARHIKDFR